MFLVVVQKQHQ